MGLIHQPKDFQPLQKKFNIPLQSFRDLYASSHQPYLNIILPLEIHMYFYRPVISELHAVQNIQDPQPRQMASRQPHFR
jgi:hypothetical protein